MKQTVIEISRILVYVGVNIGVLFCLIGILDENPDVFAVGMTVLIGLPLLAMIGVSFMSKISEEAGKKD